MRKQLWVWPIVAAVMLGVIGLFLRERIETASKAELADQLQTLLQADVTALQIWLETQRSHAVSAAADRRVRRLTAELVSTADSGADKLQLLQSPQLAELRDEFQPMMEMQDYHGFAVIDRDNRILAASRDDAIGRDDFPFQEGIMAKIFAGRSTVSRPFKSAMVLHAEQGPPRAGVPTMFVTAPILDEGGKVIAALGLRIRPEGDFTRILSVARAGETGETYAFDASGLLLSQSRFDEELKQIGLITDREETKSILNLGIRDPVVDMTSGQRPTIRRANQSLTRMAADAVAGNSGVDVDGYRDYRGVPVIGAWTWLEEYGFGVATEVDVAEAYRPLNILRYTFWGLFALLAASAVAIGVFTAIVSRLNRTARRATLKAKKLGQYTLEQKLGEGGMGVVYRAHHAMLHRPTAVKFLDLEKTNEQTIARFEREVRLTSQLSHPNTIVVYDFGHTPEGVFYYAMEYLDGLDLNSLVQRFGPQPEGRVVHILEQICGSLVEAHGVGLIHRDIKPANLIISRRGGIDDFVKLLDFGLVKAVDGKREASLTSTGAMTGTPLYLSPEGIQSPASVDARSDLYAVGAVGYFLLTGTPVFDGETVIEIISHQVKTFPQRPSERLGKSVSAGLEELLLRCLEKDPSKRPQTAAELAKALSDLHLSASWAGHAAQSWWNEYALDDTSGGVALSTDDVEYAATFIATPDQLDD